MRVIVAGSRTITDCQKVADIIYESLFDINEIVSGTAQGVDKCGENWAHVHNISLKQFPADWNTYGKSAGYIRNSQMAEYADALIAIWDGKSRGTKHMIDEMNKLNKPVFLTIC